jgi:hypothetical protein
VSASWLFKLLRRYRLEGRSGDTPPSRPPPSHRHRLAMLIEELNIEIVGLDGSPLRRLILDPAKDYQRIP